MNTWDEESIEYLLRAKKEGQTYQQIADEVGMHAEAVRSKYRHLTGSKGDKKSETTCNTPTCPQRATKLPLVLDLHQCIVSSDFHTPGENEKAVQALIQYATKHKIKHMIIGGDFWNQDSVSRWELKDPSMSLPYEIERGLKLIERLTKHMKLYFVRGNHDVRMCKVINYALSYSEWMKSIVGNKFGKSVFVTDFDYAYLNSSGTKFRVCHPDMYSRVKGSQVGMIAHDLQENVIMGHQHFFSVSTNKTGRYICIDSGCMCDPKKFLYKNASTSKCPEWENAFLHIKGGRVHPITWYTF